MELRNEIMSNVAEHLEPYKWNEAEIYSRYGVWFIGIG